MFSLKTEALMPYKAKSDLPDNVRN
ncbi:TPA: cation transport regulator, partial [Salmonella enterica subsp. enterica serovar Enteritidis]|nr:cation transport regulator [Salmonella enterica subsp. enterica serovar Enteritidis]